MKYLYILPNRPHILVMIAENEIQLEKMLLNTGKYDWGLYRNVTIENALKIPLTIENSIIYDRYWSFLR